MPTRIHALCFCSWTLGSRSWALALVAVGAAALAGCGSVCSGPGCEDFYTVGRLSGIRADDLPTDSVTVLDVWADADLVRYDGGAGQGPDWSVGVVTGGDEVSPAVIVGQPEADQVLRLGPADGIVDVAGTEAVWADTADGGFGADLAVLVTDAATGAYDLWVSSPDVQGGAGRVSVFRDAHLDEAGSATPGVGGPTPELEITGISGFDGLGTRLVPCGDLTGDGLPEVAVTLPRFSTPDRWVTDPPPAVADLAGAVLLVRSELAADRDGVVQPWDVGPVWWGDTEGEGAGAAVACSRDLDGDGILDVAIGAPWWGGGRGRVYLVEPDGAGGLPDSGPLAVGRTETGEEVAWRTVTDPSGDEGWFGEALVAIDAPLGLPQLVVGAPGAAAGDGAVYVFDTRALSGDTAPEPIAAFSAGDRPEEHVGRTLAVGDLGGTGLQDLLIGAQDGRGEAANPLTDTGVVYVWSAGTRLGWDLDVDVEDAPIRVAGTQPFQRIGRRIIAGDLDGDGVDELWLPTRSAGTRPRDP